MKKQLLSMGMALLVGCLIWTANSAALEWKPEHSVACGIGKTIAVKSDGTVWVWGNNTDKASGTGSEATLLGTPLQVIGLTNVVRVTAAFGFLALKSDGSVWEWGTSDLTTPAHMVELSNIIAISRGATHSMALSQDGKVWTWGDNEYGQLGNGDETKTDQPMAIESLMRDAMAISTGYEFSVAIKNDGTVWAWGKNDYGQLGNGITTKSFVPVQVSNITDIKAISSSYQHTLALDKNGSVWAWGYNYYGRLGDGTQTTRKTPIQVKNLSDVAAVAVGWDHSLALKKDGTVWAWGHNYSGQLGIGSTQDQWEPVQVVSIQNAIAIAAGNEFSFAVTKNGEFWAWGSDSDGQLGDNFHVAKTSVPTQVKLTNVQSVATGGRHTAAVTTDQRVWMWGYNYFGQLGDNTKLSKNAPFALDSLSDAKMTAAGGDHTLCLKNDGTVWAWGSNYQKQLGNTTVSQTSVPVQTANLTDVKWIASGNAHSFAVKTDGSLWGWGQNNRQQVGDGTFDTAKSEPVAINGISNVKAIAGGLSHTIAIDGNNTVWTWGSDERGQLGRDGKESVPGQVPNLTDVTAVAAGYTHSLAVQSGNVWAWGSNYEGEVGDGTTKQKDVPVQVPGLSDVIAVAGGSIHSLALKSDGTVWAWGDNSLGQLGDGTLQDKLTPVQVVGLSNVKAIAAYGDVSYALKQDGTLWAWGSSSYGQIGDGTAWVPNQTLGREGNGFFNLFPLPDGRKDYALAYFPPLNTVILHGGWTEPNWQAMKDLWKLDATGRWSELILETTPAFSQHSMTYDSDREVLRICGNKGTSFETWEFTGTLWTKKTDTPTSMFGDVEIAFDPNRRVTVLYVGQKDKGSETWEYDGYSWTKKTSVNSPPGFDHGASLRYDEKNQKTVLVGYEENLKQTQTWTWNGTNWTQIQGPQPEKSLFGSMAYDSERQNMVFLTTDMKTWTFDGSTWTQKQPASSPSPVPLSNFMMTYHPVLKVVLFFSGESLIGRANPKYPTKTWAWNGVFWSEYPGVKPAVIGDLNNDGDVTLADVTLALQMCSGMQPSGLRPNYPSSGADVNGDGKPGMEEAIFGLQKVAILR